MGVVVRAKPTGTIFFQCELVRENVHQVAWIPERGAVIGASVAIKNEHGVAEFWQVIFVPSTGITEEQLKTLQTHNHKPFASIS